MGWVVDLVDFLLAKTPGGKIIFGSKGTYDQFYGNLDFLDDDIPNVRAVKAIAGAVGSYPLISIPAGSAIPLSIDCTSGDYSGLPVNANLQAEILNADISSYTESDPIYDIQIRKFFVDNPDNTELDHILIYGHPDPADSGITIDDIIVRIR